MSDEPTLEPPEATGASEGGETGDVAQTPDAAKTPDAAQAPDVMDTPKVPESPEAREAAEAFDTVPPSPSRLGYRSRSERRTYRRAARRRRSRTKLWLLVGPVVIVIAVIVVLLILLGGPEGSADTTTTTVPAKVYASGFLVVEQGDTAPVAVLLHSRETGGLVMGMSGLTLLLTSGGFETLADLHTSGRDGELDDVLTDALGVRAGPVVTVQWSDLRPALLAAGIYDVPGENLAFQVEESEQIAVGVLALMGGDGNGGRSEIWDELPLEGDTSGFREALDEIVSSLPVGDWAATSLTGRSVEGEGFRYLEPDVRRANALLSGVEVEMAIAVQVQNGSGVVGIAEQATALLEPKGYTMLPVGNAEGFPDVQKTRIEVSPDVASEGWEVRSVIGVGIVTENQMLEPGHIIVVLGKDFVPPTATDTTQPSG